MRVGMYIVHVYHLLLYAIINIVSVVAVMMAFFSYSILLRFKIVHTHCLSAVSNAKS